jgi:hypothetical protein
MPPILQERCSWFNPSNNEALRFSNGLASAHVGGELQRWASHQSPRWKGGKWQFIDKTGKVVWQESD